jgi:hypothetical protein
VLRICPSEDWTTMFNELDGLYIKCSKQGVKLNMHQGDKVSYLPLCGYESINLFLFFVSVLLHGRHRPWFSSKIQACGPVAKGAWPRAAGADASVPREASSGESGIGVKGRRACWELRHHRASRRGQRRRLRWSKILHGDTAAALR